MAPKQSDDDAETPRIQAYLDSLYKRSDVVSTFRTKFGEDIDCIDFYAQPSVKMELARGHKVYIPTDLQAFPHEALPQQPDSSDPLADAAFNGEPDENGKPRACSV